MIHNIDLKRLKNGHIITQIKKDFMGLLQNSLNILKKARPKKGKLSIRMFGSTKLFIQA